jgi:glycosyltransferase involved in cell wall biosynthesis
VVAAAQSRKTHTSSAQEGYGGFMTPEVSVILPVHNRQDTLGRAIQSVLDQTFRDFELIIIDDGSKDLSAKVAKSFADPRIRFIQLPNNRGGNAARNEGLKASQAPLIAFLDSDDTFLPEKLERVVAIFGERPELELLVDSFVKVQPPGSRRERVIRSNPRIEDQEQFRRALFTRQLWKATPSISLRREAAMRAGMFDETLKRLQDFDFLIRVASVARCASTDEVLWVKYWDAVAISAQDTMISANAELVKRHPEYLSTRAYRPGLAYAVRLSLWRKLRKGQLGGIASDIRQLRNGFGTLEAARLLVEALFRGRRFEV